MKINKNPNHSKLCGIAPSLSNKNLSIISSFLLILLFSSFVSSAGVSSPYWDKDGEGNENPLILSPGETKNTATAAQKLGLKTIVCLSSLGQAQKWGRHLKTDYLVYEPLEFIGSSTDSVSTRRPEIIKKIADLVSPLPLLVGAGIRTPEDIKIALSLGAAGFLISSAVVLAKNPRQKLTTLAKSLA